MAERIPAADIRPGMVVELTIKARVFGHVPSFDPYGDDVDCGGCCPICGALS